MFTGIIQHTGKIDQITRYSSGLEITISCPFAADTHIDESISINGVCQTVTAHSETTFTVQTVEETLRKTNFGTLEIGDKVNLERSLTLNSLIEGHLVQGHVDCTGTVQDFTKEGTNRLLTIELPDKFKNHIVGRGSIAVDGISLTIARDLGNAFIVAIIPYTLEHTNLNTRKKGDKLNLEFDILGKYVLKYLSNLGQRSSSALTEEN